MSLDLLLLLSQPLPLVLAFDLGLDLIQLIQ